MTALTRESYSESFEEIFGLVKYTKPKKQKQKVMIEQYMIELLHKLLLLFWRNYFSFVYSRNSNEEFQAKREEIMKMAKNNPKQHVAYEKFCKFAHLLLILLVRHVDRLILGAQFSIEDLATYTFAYFVAFLVPTIMLQPVGRAAYPAFIAFADDPPRKLGAYRLATLFLLDRGPDFGVKRFNGL